MSELNPQAPLSILIITYNRLEDTLLLLKNLLLQQRFDSVVQEILLLNNNSSDDYADLEKFIALHPQLKVKYFNHHENLGVARGRNFLIPKAQAPYLLVIDDDMEFEDREAMVKLSVLLDQVFFKENNTALVTFGVFYFENKERQLIAFPHKVYDEFLPQKQFLTYYFAGGAHVVRRDLFDTIGLYTEDFFSGMEEYDLSYRILLAGFTIGYDDSVAVLHKESPNGRMPNKQKLAMLWLNKSKVAWRYLPKKYFYSTAFMWSLQFLKQTHFDFKSWIKTFRNIFQIPKTEKRKPITPAVMAYLKNVKARLWY